MKKFVSLLLAAVLMLSLTACGSQEEAVEGLSLYVLASEESRLGGDVVTASVIPWSALPEERQAQAEDIMVRLLEDENSPLPAGTTLRSVELSGSTAYVDLGGPYGYLSGVDLSIADYCITLSLTQLTGVYAVRTLADGRELQQRSKQVFLAGDALLSSMDDVVRTLTAKLYFPDETGEMVPEERLLTQYEGESTAQVVLAALIEGPERDGLLPLLPEDFVGMTARVESGVCHLNIPADAIGRIGDDAVAAIIRSLMSAEGIREVQLYADGQPQ